MIDNRYVCPYPQYHYCGKSGCPLSKYCARFSLIQCSLASDLSRKKSRVTKTLAEKKQHQQKYTFYNTLFGDLAEKRKRYAKKYYQENRDLILAVKRKEPSYRLPIVYDCEHECSACPYEDCQITLYTNRKEYMAMYSHKFHEKLLKQKAEYRKRHRTYLANSEKIRNYKKKGYVIRDCVCSYTTSLTMMDFVAQDGIITTFKINGKDYFSFVSADREASCRCRICESIGSLSNPECGYVIFKDADNNEYRFFLYS